MFRCSYTILSDLKTFLSVNLRIIEMILVKYNTVSCRYGKTNRW